MTSYIINYIKKYASNITKKIHNTPHELLEYDKKPEDRIEALRVLINNLSNESATIIWQSKKTVEELGLKILGMHPFTEWEFFLSEENEEIQRKIKIITDEERCSLGGLSVFSGLIFDETKNQFLEGFALDLEHRHEVQDLLPHLGTFAERVHIPAEELQAFIDSKRWKELIMRLIQQ